MTPSLNKRSLDQNAKLHAMCGDVAKQKQWAGEWLTLTQWKTLFVAAVYGQKVLPGLDGGFVVMNAKTSKMSKAQCSEVIAYIEAWCVDQGIRLGDE